MKKEYLVVKFYSGNYDGYLQIINKYHEYTYQKQYATLFTQKQASKIVFKLNQEMKHNFSYYYRYGYFLADSCI